MSEPLNAALYHALVLLWDRALVVNNDAEDDLFGESCPCCDGALPVAHSLGCQVKNAIHAAAKVEGDR